ncbi:hypothetical protein GYB57_15250 [bacterium]|nr:hypothetical protein [bacterium]
MENKTQKELIHDLLNYAGKSGVEKEVKQKIYNLVSTKVVKCSLDYDIIGDVVDKALEKRFGKGYEKEQVKFGSESSDIEINIKNVTDLPKYINPYFLYKFLFEYNQNPVLRSTCHDIDSEELERIKEYCISSTYVFKEHTSNIIKSYEQHEKRFFAPHQIKALFRGYLTGKNFKGKQLDRGWSSGEIKINWTNPQLIKWVEENPNIPPNFNETLAGNKEVELFPIEPQIISPITNDPIQNYTQLVLHFKNLFHLKSGKQSLREILIRNNSLKKFNEQIDFKITDSFLPNLEHFTDVDKLIQAYNKILQLIIEQHNFDSKPKVKLSFLEENHIIYLSIHHINGLYNKTIQNTLDRIGQTYSSLIKYQINGLCNLQLKADFGNDKYAGINLWNGKKRTETVLEKFTGVEHILEFPKNKE